MSKVISTLLMAVIVVVMGSMVYAWSTGLLGGSMIESVATDEVLSLDKGAISNSTTAVLYLRNIGSSSANLSRCYIYGADNLYETVDVSYSIIPNTVSIITINVPGGAGHEFQSGYSYQFKFVTSLGNHLPPTFNLKYT